MNFSAAFGAVSEFMFYFWSSQAICEILLVQSDNLSITLGVISEHVGNFWCSYFRIMIGNTKFAFSMLC